MKTLETLFSLFLAASLASAVIMVPVLTIRGLFHKRLPPSLVYTLWLLVLIRLLVPVVPQSSFSLFNLLPPAVTGEWAGHGQTASVGMPADDASRPELAVLNETAEETQTAGLASERPEQQASAPFTPFSPSQANGRSGGGGTWMTFGAAVWAGGLLLFAGYCVFSRLVFRNRLKDARRVEDEEILSDLEAGMEKLRLKGEIPVYMTDHLRSPCLHGVLKPRIVLPGDLTAIADSRQLSHILLHELTHYKRKDLWINSLWVLTLGLHWYNPLVWIAFRKMKADQEAACDAGVLEALGERESTAYGMTLIMLSRHLSRGVSFGVHLTHFLHSRHETKRRVARIAGFKKGTYKLSAAALGLVLLLGAVLLTNASRGGGTGKGPAVLEEGSGGGAEDKTAAWKIVRPIDSFKWFHRLGRAFDFAAFAFKVPDYFPEGYQFETVTLSENFSMPEKADLLEMATLTLVADFGQPGERRMEVVASRGKGTMLEHQLLWGAPRSWEQGAEPLYRSKTAVMGNIQGVLYTSRTADPKRGTAASFIWQDEGVDYTVNYYTDRNPAEKGSEQRKGISQLELERVVQSLVYPDEVRHVRYDGKGNSFPIYDETDLREAESILGFDVKYPLELPEAGLAITDSILLRANDRNTGFSFRQRVDALVNYYRAPYDSEVYDLNDELAFYQSKTPLFEQSKLAFLRKIERNGIEISVYGDPDHVYFGPLPSDRDKNAVKQQTYYLWSENGVNYAAIFLGMDQKQEEHVEALIQAPLKPL